MKIMKDDEDVIQYAIKLLNCLKYEILETDV